MDIRISKREKALVSAVLITALFFLYYRYYLSPMLGEYRFISETVRDSEEELGSLKETEKEINLLLADIEELQSDITGLKVLIPQNLKTPEIIIQIESCSRSAGVVLESILFDRHIMPENGEKDAKRDIHYLEIPVHIFISGPYENIMAFLKELEGAGRLYNITGFSLFAQPTLNEDILGMSIDLIAYALLIDGKLAGEPLTYDFMGEGYGRDNPFRPVTGGE